MLQGLPIRAILFDFDGTLVDTMASFADTAAGVISARYPMPHQTARARYLETSGVPFFQQLEVLFPGDARNKAAADTFEQQKLDAFFDESFEPDVVETLATLRDCGLFVGVSSNNFQSLVERFVSREQVPFDAVLGCIPPDFFKGKDHFDYLQNNHGVAPSETLFVGDSLMDAVRAAESGVRFVGRTGTFGHADFNHHTAGTPTVDRLSELLALIPEATL